MGHREMVEIGDDGTLGRRYARIWCETPLIVDLALHGHARTPLLVTRQSTPAQILEPSLFASVPDYHHPSA